ncbi:MULTISPECIES: zinc-binding dehydrogenase [unclassified Streptomyces]|uniref:zinc-binding dehydrogenase n=1 Tax=unclassified Streptomyces TaxID=2593676 RepID=UPI0037FFB0D3
MHAARLHSFGPAENLTYERTEDPLPAPGQVRIAVAAAGVHLIDTAFREGLEGGPVTRLELPVTLGREVAGTVESLGEGVDPALLGTRVVAHLGGHPGGYAELAVVDAARLHSIPENLDAAEAVAMIGTGRTAMGIVQFADLNAESVAIVPAAAGGIGTLLVQYAKNLGATVIGLAGGPAKVARVKENGADLAVDYTLPNWPEEARRFLDGIAQQATVVFDSVGGPTGLAAVDLLGPGGRHLAFGHSSQGLREGTPLTFPAAYLAERGITSRSVLGPVMLQQTGGPDPLRTLETQALTEAATGRLHPAVHRFPLSEAASAHRALENRGTVGKVVLVP